jgi:hypothetical protein
MPGLSGLRLYETTQSYCDYRGPTLEEYQASGGAAVLRPFLSTDYSERRQRLIDTPADNLLRFDVVS